jgi:methylmalonyl-CoA mutase N-terminal domain/subunit
MKKCATNKFNAYMSIKASRTPVLKRELLPALKAIDRMRTIWRVLATFLALAMSTRSRARCTVGEISDALEIVFKRFQATHRSVSGVYGSHFQG